MTTLRLQVQSDDGIWRTLNTQRAADDRLAPVIAEMLRMRDNWRLTEFPAASFRIHQERR